MISLWDEHIFWLEMLQDHAYFLRDHLSPAEVQYVNMAQNYIQYYEDLLVELQKIPKTAQATDQEMILFSRKVWPVVKGYFDLEGHIQALRTQNKVNVNLVPSYFNGTLLENEEYLRILSYLVQGKEFSPLSLHSLMALWLEDQGGHAALLRSVLDPVEVGAIAQAEAYVNRFQVYLAQNKQLERFLRFTKPGFPRDQEFAYEVGKTTLEMKQFINAIVQRYKADSLLNRTTLRFLEHHYPETCYFLIKLSYYEPRLQKESEGCSLRRFSY